MCIYSHDNALPVFGLRGVWVSWMCGGCWMLKTWEMESWISVVVLTLIGLTDGRTMSPPDKIRYNWVLWYTHVCVVHIYVGIHMYLYTQMLLSGVWGCWMLRLWAMVSWSCSEPQCIHIQLSPFYHLFYLWRYACDKMYQTLRIFRATGNGAGLGMS